MKSVAFAIMMALTGVNVEANEYYDYLGGGHVEITDGRIAEGEMVEYYDWNTSSYRYGEVTGVDGYGDVELFDYESGRVIYLEEE